jgi:hypothetical protein
MRFRQQHGIPSSRPSVAPFLTAILAAGALTGCPKDPGETPDAMPPPTPDLENVQNLFTRSCAGSTCHINYINDPGGALDLSPGASCANLVQVASVEAPANTLLVPGNPDQSYLVCKATPNCADLPERAVLMPPPSGLGQADLDLLRAWIDAGAPGCTTGNDVTPPTFAGARVAAGQSQAIRLEWEPAVDDVTQSENIVYAVYQATTSSAQDFSQEPILVTAPGATEAVVSGLAVSTPYFYVVRARDAAGNQDTNTVEVTATTLAISDTMAPTFAGATGATALGGTVIEVTWGAASDDVSPAGDIIYNVYMSETSGTFDFATPVLTAPAGSTSAAIRRLRSGVTYFFVVRAQDRALNEDTNTAEVSATTDDGIFFPQDIQPIFTASCATTGCHVGASPAQGLDLSEGNAYAELFQITAEQCVDNRLRVDPSKPADDSYLVQKLLGVNLCGDEINIQRMPRFDDPLPPEDIDIVRQWITEGALETPPAAVR